MNATTVRDRVPEPLVSNRRIVFLEAVVLFLVVWEAGSRLFDAAVFVSSPMIVGAALYDLMLTGEWIPHFVASMKRILYGFGASVVFGIAFGVLLGVSDFWREALRLYVLVGMAVPGLLVVIFSAMWFGISDYTPMVATAVVTTPFIADVIQGGVEDIDQDLLTMSGAFGVTKWRMYRWVLFPSILPQIFSSVRFAFSVAWKVVVLAEVVIANVGIGFVIRDEMNQLSMTGVVSYLVLFVVVMLLIEYGLFRQVERVVFDWREDVKSTMAAGGQ